MLWSVMRLGWAKAQLLSECPGCLSSALHDLLRPSEGLAPSSWTPGGSLWRGSKDRSKPGDSKLVIAAWMFLVLGLPWSSCVFLWFLMSSLGLTNHDESDTAQGSPWTPCPQKNTKDSWHVEPIHQREVSKKNAKRAYGKLKMLKRGNSALQLTGKWRQQLKRTPSLCNFQIQ